MKTIFAITVAALLCGCSAIKDHIIVNTATVLGISASQNQTTGLYEARLGYFRNEFAFVPGNTNAPESIPDVMMELRMENIFKGGFVYQRLAVGKNAVSQPGAMIMFAKDANGLLSSNAVDAITRKVNAIPLAPTGTPSLMNSITNAATLEFQKLTK